MPDLKQALRDFVATSNSGKYATEQELISKFPELKGYDIQALKDFVATSNSGKYATEEELFSKFPEFNQGAPIKKKFALDSSSEVGSSESQKPPKKKFSIGELGEQPNVVSRDATFVKTPEIKISKKEIKNITQRKKEDEALSAEKKKYGDIFDKQLNIKPNVDESKYLKDRLATVNTELINKEEEYVVPELEYQFGDLGFKFEESGATGDYVKVTAPNGKTTEISLDNLLSSKSKTQSDLLQSFIKQNTPAKGLFVLEKTMREQDKKFNSQKQVDDSIKVISDELNNLNTKQKQFLAKKNQFEKELEKLGANPDPQALALLEQQRVSLNEEMKSILQEEDKIKQKGKKLDAAVGKYSIAKAKQGTLLGGIRDAFFGGVGRLSSGATSLMTDVYGSFAPIVKDGSFISNYVPPLYTNEEATNLALEAAEKMGLNVPKDRSQASINKFKQSLTEDQLDEIESYVRDQAKKNVKKEMLPLMRVGAKEIFGDPETTQQWENLKKEGFWGGAILGLSESLPAMIGGAGPIGFAQRTAQMYAQVSDGLAEEMEKDPDFKDVSENEKLAITLPIGIVGAVLENVGLKNIKGSQGLINNIALKALGKAGKGVTAKTFRELVENEVDNAIARGALTITAAGAAEFETGAAQELAETGFKELYNEIKDKKMFDTPESITDLMENVVVSGAQEAVGGFVLGVPTSVSAAYSEKGFLKMDDTSFETFANMANDEKMQSAYVTSLKEKITRGEVTTKEAKDQLNNYRNSVGLFRQLPEGLDTRQKKEAMNLLKEKKDLENYVEGKDAALVVKQKNRITEINDSLTKLTEENAVQEQSTTEIPVQSETGISETVAEGISQPKPEVVTEQVTQEEIAEPVIAQPEPTAPQTIIEEQPDVVKVKKSDDFMNDAEHVVTLNGEEAGRMYYDRSSKSWRDPNFDRSKFKPESFERVYGDILGETKQEATDELIRRTKESMKQETPVKEVVVEEAVVEKPQEVQFTKDTVLNRFLNKLNELNPLQKNPINNKSFVYGDKASLEFNRFDKGDKNEISLEGISSFDKGKGLGKEVMSDIAKSADELGVTLTLEAKPFGKDGLGKKELIDFYKKNGFEVDQQYLEDLDFGSEQEAIDYVLENESEALPMVRTPKISELQAVSEQVDFISKEYDSDNENNDKNMSVLSQVLDKEGIVPPAEPMILESEKLVSVTYRGQDFNSPETTITFNKNKNGSWSVKGYKVETTTAETAPVVDDLLKLDTKDQTNLQRVLDYLDGLDSSLDLDPNELNDVTRVMAISTAKAIVKTLKALVKAGITLQEAINAASEIHSVDNKDVLKAFDVIKQGGKQKSAPSPSTSDIYAGDGRIISIVKDVNKITMREKDLLIKQIKDRAKGARESVQAWKEQSKQFADELNELVKSGKVTNKQVGAILKRFSKVNIFSEKSMNRFTDYMVKVFNDSNYKEKLSQARKTLSSIKKLSKNSEKNADLRAVGSEFSKIEPSMVENIEEYNDIASKLKTAIDGSKARGGNVKIADTINIDEVSSYIEKTISEQEEKLQQEKINEIQDLFGVDASEFSAEEIDAMLESEEDLSNDNEKIVKDAIKKAFDVYSSVIKEMLSTGVDPFTDEKVSFTDKQKDIIKRFMGIDIEKIKNPKDALRMVDSLINFIQNKSTSGMLGPIADFEAIKDSDVIVDKGIKAIRLRKYFSPKIGRLLGQKTTTLPVLFEKMFKGVTPALEVEEAISVSDLINDASKAESEGNLIVKQYTKEFYNKKANGESYNSAYNDVERGVFAHVNRNVIGTKARQKEVFEKRKQEVLDTIKVLETSGNESEIELAKNIKKAYDKILDGSNSINDVRSKTDAENIKGVEFWINKWDSKYEALSDLAKDFYNKTLGRDLGYTPDRIIKLQDKRGDVELEDIQSQFFANTDEILYDKKSGSLMDKQENRSIPKDMYIDFSFDKKNSNAMYDALTDLYTAFDIRKVGSFLKSDNFKKIFPSKKDASLIDKRIKNFVRIVRKKTPYSNSELSDVLRYADKLAKLGVTASLASLSQPIKQTVPVMASTLINAGSLGMGANLNRGYNEWLNNIGYAISNRGSDAQIEIESINKLIDKAADMPKEKALKYIQKQQDRLLKLMLVNPDVWVARASFKAYYEQSLNRQGLQSSNIDYTKHEVNKKAANYAQRMVDRQQNISNHALAGDLYTSESDATKVLIKMLAPFSSFRMNQSARLGSDLTTLEYWNTSTKEDKIIALRSIAGYAVESATFRALQIGVSLAMHSLATLVLGGDSDEEDDEKYLNNLLKGTGTSAFLDTFSPVPSADPFFQDALASSIDLAQTFMDTSEEEKFKLFSSQEQSALKILGTYGIPFQRAKEIYDLGSLAYTAKYKDKYGKEKEISEQNADELKKILPVLFTSSLTGIASPDVASLSRNAVKLAKSPEKKINMELLKRTSPDMYERIKSSKDRDPNKEIQDRIKERKKEIEKRMNR